MNTKARLREKALTGGEEKLVEGVGPRADRWRQEGRKVLSKPAMSFVLGSVLYPNRRWKEGACSQAGLLLPLQSPARACIGSFRQLQAAPRAKTPATASHGCSRRPVINLLAAASLILRSPGRCQIKNRSLPINWLRSPTAMLIKQGCRCLARKSAKRPLRRRADPTAKT